MARTSRKNQETMKKTEVPVMKVALYARLSIEDNGCKGRDSIQNQLTLLQDFAGQLKNAKIIDTYVDNGHTGTDFARPEWERMMEDIKAQRVDCIIVKDLSRFARNYLEAGEYLQKIFPFMGVRFIAVNDLYDSANEIFPEKDLLAEFKNLANDYYSRDISKKILSAFEAKRAQGKVTGGKAPYGYLIENGRYVVDEPAAAVVRRIFEMKLEGVSSPEIVKILNQEGVPSPGAYAAQSGMKKYRKYGNVLWCQREISRILYNRAYVGDLVQGKFNWSKYSGERLGAKKEDMWRISENTHQAIISREQFRQVQEKREKNRAIWRERQGGEAYGNVLKGILVCGTCQHAMWRRKVKVKGKVCYYFICGYASSHSNVECDTDSIMDYRIFEIVLSQIKLQIDLAVELKTLIEEMKKTGRYAAQCEQKKKEIMQMSIELGRCSYLKNSLYEDMKQGILTKEEYLMAKERYAQRITELEKDLEKRAKEQEAFARCMDSDNKWLDSFLRYRDATELTRDMAVELLEKVEVYKDNRIHIIFRFRNEYEYMLSQLALEDKEGGEKDGRAVCG